MTDAALLATWPPLALHAHGPWQVAEGGGGGKRVSCAFGDGGPDDIPLAEAALARLGQEALFMLRPGQDALDAALAGRGYRLVDPCCLYQGDVARIASEGPDWMTTFPHWPPLEVCREIWAQAGIGPARIAVMARVAGAKAVILGRVQDRPAAAGFVALHGDEAMLHALEIRPLLRRKGLGRQMLRAAAKWAAEAGASRLGLAVTSANQPARALYASLGMQVVGHYHYRLKPATA